MKIYVSQIYIEAGINYPFSHHFQAWLSQELTNRVRPSRQFLETYSDQFNIVFNVSAKVQLKHPQVKGPTVFRRTKDVEYTVFLPHNGVNPNSANALRQPLRHLIDSIADVLQGLGMDVSKVLGDSSAMIEHVISIPKMVREQPSS